MTLHDILRLTAIAHVFSRGTIFARMRTSGPALWRELAGCPLCAGWWIGALGCAALATPGAPLVRGLGDASIVATLALFVYGLIRRI